MMSILAYSSHGFSGWPGFQSLRTVRPHVIPCGPRVGAPSQPRLVRKNAHPV